MIQNKLIQNKIIKKGEYLVKQIFEQKGYNVIKTKSCRNMNVGIPDFLITRGDKKFYIEEKTDIKLSWSQRAKIEQLLNNGETVILARYFKILNLIKFFKLQINFEKELLEEKLLETIDISKINFDKSNYNKIKIMIKIISKINKIIRIEEEVWWKLNQLKLNWRLKKLSDVINRLIDIQKTKENATEGTLNTSNNDLEEQLEVKK